MAGLFKWGGRKGEVPAAPAPPATVSSAPPPRSTKVLPRFLSALSTVEAPVLLNLGPVVGQNIAFFGDRLSCKIFVEDFFADVEARTAGGSFDGLMAALDLRLQHAPGSIDGVLCWDLFDYLDKPTSQALAARLVSLLRPGGVLYAFFSTTPAPLTHHTRFIVEGPDSFQLRTTPTTLVRPRNVLVTRDITKMFQGLAVTESVLLKSNTQETLFRKPA